MKREDLIEDAAVGGVSGFLATLPMTISMVIMHRFLPEPERFPLPPRQITMKMADEAGVKRHMDEEERTAATYVAHFGYGAAAGTVYGIASRAAGVGAGARTGILFGLIVWFVSYLGLLPAARILPPATEHPAGRNALMIIAHVIWGAALGATHEYMAESRPWDRSKSCCCSWFR
jgi:uncharacterized membrane protein YagU involved in acid resistance